MRPALLLASVAVLMANASLQAQSRVGDPGGWRPARVAKWALLGASVGFGVYALSHSRQAERAYGNLRSLCYDQPTHCALAANRYTSADAEALFSRATAQDRHAQVGIVGGQLSLLGGVALFIYDLRNGRGPVNIPFPLDSSSHDFRGRKFAKLR